jgi:hypothetical protein
MTDNTVSVIQHHKNDEQAGCQWLMPIILTTWEAQIGRMMVPGQPWQIVYGTSIPK